MPERKTSLAIWGRRVVVGDAKNRGCQDSLLSCPSDVSASGEEEPREEVVEDPHPVTLLRRRPSAKDHDPQAQAPLADFVEQDLQVECDHSAAAAAAAAAAAMGGIRREGRRGRTGLVKGNMMLSARRWASSRSRLRVEGSGSSSASESPGPADDEESPLRPRSSAFRKKVGGDHRKPKGSALAPTHAIYSSAGPEAEAIAATAVPPSQTMSIISATTAPSINISSGSPAAKLGRRGQRRPRACPLREQLLRSRLLPVLPPNSYHNYSSSESETTLARSATTTAASAAAAASTTTTTGEGSSTPLPFPGNLKRITTPPSSRSSSVFENEIAPLSSPATSTSSETPCWAERAGLTAGAGVRRRPPDACTSWYSAGNSNNNNSNIGSICSTNMHRKNDRCSRSGRDVPRFLRPVMLMLTMSILAIVGTTIEHGGWKRMGMLGLHSVFCPAVHAAGGAQLPEAVVDDIFDRADKDHDGVIADEEIQYLVEGAGGSRLDDASEIAAGVASVIKNLDLNADHTLSRSDLLTHWKRLGTLLTVDEVAEWVVHAVQLPQDVADNFRSNMVTGYDFPELAAKQGKLLEQDLGITRPAFRKRLVRSMKWKLWGMGEEPAAPDGFRATNTSCGALSLEWEKNEGEGSLSFPVHKFVLRRAPLEQREATSAVLGAGQWTTVMQGSDRGFFDSRVKPGAGYRYSLQAWNALGHSSAAEIDVVVATDDCVEFWWLGSGGASIAGLDYLLGIVVAILSLILGTAYVTCYAAPPRRVRPEALRSLSKSDRGNSQEGGAVSVTGAAVIKGSSSSPRSSTGASGGGLSTSSIPREPSIVNSSRRLLRTESVPVKKYNANHEVVTGTLSERRVNGSGGGGGGGGGGGSTPAGGGLDSRPEISAAIASMRKEAARRLMTRQSTSHEDKELCKLCGREWKWFNRRGKHTCCNCHELFCDKCGVVSHTFWACPVGGSCTCSECAAGSHSCRRS